MIRIGVLGFGEAGSTFASALADAGAVVDSYDQLWDQSDARDLRKRSTELQLADDFASKPELMDDVVEALLQRLSRRHI